MNDDKVKEVAERLILKFAERGQIVEGGWQAYELVCGLTDAPEIQRVECRKAFYLGAHHVMASMMTMLDKGDEATALDLDRMDKLWHELQEFVKTLKKPNN